MTTNPTSLLTSITTAPSPFPGLRPFEAHESDLFFGRDEQVEKLIQKLEAKRFLAVVGTSGSGKSSLVRAGLMPALRSGQMIRVGSNWRIAIMRPSNDPIGNLAQALNEPDIFGSVDATERMIQVAITESTLRLGSRGLIEAVRQNEMPASENLLVIVDQFEELFRFAREARKSKDERFDNDAAAFVKLLLEAVKTDEPGKYGANIYVVLTMRSDFLGDCAQFWDLPEATNESQYLIPRLTRDQLREVIEGPVAVGGGKITQPLVNQLLNDIGDDQDQLPVLQHALMRTWEEWKKPQHNHLAAPEVIDVCCYNAIGKMANALSKHADEALLELREERRKLIAEKLFKRLTEKGEDNREIRRPVTLDEICAVAEATPAEVSAVIDAFRRPPRSFLMPPDGTPLELDTLIDISHESLIRVWEQLKTWVKEEAESATTYRRLVATALLHSAGRAELWYGADLQVGLEWQDRQQPNQAWAKRYHQELDLAQNFLTHSQEESTAKQRAEEQRRRKELVRARAFAIILAIAALASAGMAVYANQLRVEAESSRKRAEEQERRTSDAKIEADRQKTLAEQERDRANGQTQIANEQRDKAEKQERFANAQRQIADSQTLIALDARKQAEKQKQEADTQRLVAEEQTRIAQQERDEAKRQKGEADTQRALAESQKNRAEELNRLAEKQIAELFGLRADKVRNESTFFDVSALLAVHSLKLQPTLDGYEALFATMALGTRPLSERPPIGKVVRSALSGDGNYVAAISEDGRLSIREVQTGQIKVQIQESVSNTATLTLSHSGKFVAALDMELGLKLWRGDDGRPLGSLPNSVGKVGRILFSPDENLLAVASGEVVQLWNLPSLRAAKPPLRAPLPVNVLTFSQNSKALAFTYEKVIYENAPVRLPSAKPSSPVPVVTPGIIVWHTDTGATTKMENITTNVLQLSPDGKFLVEYRADRKSIEAWRVVASDGFIGEKILQGTFSGIESLKISQDGKYIAAVIALEDLDGNSLKESAVQVWRISGKDVPYPTSINTQVQVTEPRFWQEIARWTTNTTVTQPTFSEKATRLSLLTNQGAVLVRELGGGLSAATFTNESQPSFFFDPVNDRRLIIVKPDSVQRLNPFTNERVEMPWQEPIQKSIDRVISISRDGSRLLTLGNLAKIYDLHTGQIVARIKPLTWRKRVGFSPDGKLLTSFREDRTIMVEDLYGPDSLDSLQSARRGSFQSDDRELRSLALSKTGRYLATVTPDNRVRIRQLTLLSAAEANTSSNRPIDAVEVKTIASTQEVTALCFSPDDKRLALATGNVVQLWETTSGKPFEQLSVFQFKHQARINALAFNSSGKLLVTASDDRTVRIWDVASGPPASVSLQHNEGVTAVAFSQDGKQLATASGNIARVWDVSSGRPVGVPIKTIARVQSLAFKLRSIGPFDEYIPVSPEANAPNRQIEKKSQVREKDELTLVTLDEKRYMEEWAIETGKPWNLYGSIISPPRPLPLPLKVDEESQDAAPSDSAEVSQSQISEEMEVVAISPAGVTIKSLGFGGIYSGGFYRLALNPDGKSFAAWSGDQQIQIWSVSSQQKIAELPINGRLNDMVYSSDGRYLAVGSVPQNYEVALEPEGSTVTVPLNTTLQMWDMASDQPKEQFNEKLKDRVYKIVFSPDDKYLALAANRQVLFLNARNAQQIGTPITPKSDQQPGPGTISFSPDGKYLVMRSIGGLDFWDIETRQQFIRLATPAPIYGQPVLFNQSGDLLALQSGSNIQIWHWRSQDLINDACARLQRNFSSDEWQRYIGDLPYKRTCEQLPVHDSLSEQAVAFAREGKTDEAIKLFKQIADLEHDKKFDPEAEARWHALLKTESDKLYNRIIKLLADQNFDQNEFERVLTQYRTFIEIYERPHKYTFTNEYSFHSGGLEVEPINLWNGVCRLGSLYSRPAEAMDACNRAVLSNSDSTEFRNLRGIALALAGRPKEAIEDFNVFLKQYSKSFYPGDLGGQDMLKAVRQRIERLSHGEAAFTPEELQQLRKEYLRDWFRYR